MMNIKTIIAGLILVLAVSAANAKEKKAKVKGKAKEVNSAAFLKKHKLPSASSVTSAIKGLLEKDFITVNKGEYMAYDQFFVLWMKYKGILP